MKRVRANGSMLGHCDANKPTGNIVVDM